MAIYCSKKVVTSFRRGKGIAIGDAVTAHIQGCFANEAALTAAILAAGDVAALAAIDIESGWPG